MKEKLGTLLMCLVFAIPFGGIGAGAAYVIGATIRDGMAAEEWVRVKAEVLSSGSGTVLYRYTMDGKSYTGDRLGSNVIGGTDNVDSWHEDMESMLSAAKSEGKPITVWVNPDNPAESMVDRQIRWKLMMFASVFALAFGGVGLGAVVMAVASLMPRRVVSRVTNSNAGGVGVLWVFAFFWNVISFPIAILFVPEVIESGEWMGLFVLIFPLVGVLLLWGCITQTINAFRGKPVGAAAAPAPKKRPVFVTDDAPATTDAMPAMSGGSAAVSDVEQMLGGAGITLTDLQRRKFAEMPLEQQQAIRKIVRYAPNAKKVAFWVLGIFFAIQIIMAVITAFASGASQ